MEGGSLSGERSQRGGIGSCRGERGSGRAVSGSSHIKETPSEGAKKEDPKSRERGVGTAAVGEGSREVAADSR